MLALGDPDAEVAITYRIKERLRQFYQQTRPDNATIMLEELIQTCTSPAMPDEVNQLGRTLKRWQPQILAYHHARLSNSITEAMNNLIKRIKRIGFGFTNFENYRTHALLYASKPNWRLLNTIFP
ncbi:transposase [Arcanobacterium phocisimile]|nr:transposase [Arcanobacterium phocisimile]QRV02821.1 transposase [Arcanobacterium phocisimile]